MEDKLKWTLLATVAPIVWGLNYLVIKAFLPADLFLWGAALRALPAGIVLLLIARKLPTGDMWWKSLVLGLINMAGFFILIYVSAQLLPSNVAASVMSLTPVAFLFLAWPMSGERPTLYKFSFAVMGIIGALLIIGGAAGVINPWGVASSLFAVCLTAFGSLLNKRWTSGQPLLATTSWQLTWAGLVLSAIATFFEPFPPLTASTITGYFYTSIIATAIAYVCWFGALAKIPASSVGVIGLLNPVAGVLGGTLIAHESLGFAQIAGIAIVLVSMYFSTRTPAAPALANPSSNG